jgi:hypothetical protein
MLMSSVFLTTLTMVIRIITEGIGVRVPYGFIIAATFQPDTYAIDKEGHIDRRSEQ